MPETDLSLAISEPQWEAPPRELATALSPRYIRHLKQDWPKLVTDIRFHDYNSSLALDGMCIVMQQNWDGQEPGTRIKRASLYKHFADTFKDERYQKFPPPLTNPPHELRRPEYYIEEGEELTHENVFNTHCSIVISSKDFGDNAVGFISLDNGFGLRHIQNFRECFGDFMTAAALLQLQAMEEQVLKRVNSLTMGALPPVQVSEPAADSYKEFTLPKEYQQHLEADWPKLVTAIVPAVINGKLYLLIKEFSGNSIDSPHDKLINDCSVFYHFYNTFEESRYTGKRWGGREFEEQLRRPQYIIEPGMEMSYADVFNCDKFTGIPGVKNKLAFGALDNNFSLRNIINFRECLGDFMTAEALSQLHEIEEYVKAAEGQSLNLQNSRQLQGGQAALLA